MHTRRIVRQSFLWTYTSRYAAGLVLCGCTRSERKVSSFVEAVVAANSLAGVTAIVEQTHGDNDLDSTHALSLARAIREQGAGSGVSGVSSGLLLVGDADLLSPLGSARELAEAGGWGFEVIAGAGHAAPIEQPLAWRRAALAFLNRLDDNEGCHNDDMMPHYTYYSYTCSLRSLYSVLSLAAT